MPRPIITATAMSTSSVGISGQRGVGDAAGGVGAAGSVMRIVQLAPLGRLPLMFDREQRRIALSLKRDQLEEEQIRSYSEEGGATATLGDLLRQQLGEVEVAPADAAPAEPAADPAAEEE